MKRRWLDIGLLVAVAFALTFMEGLRWLVHHGWGMIALFVGMLTSFLLGYRLGELKPQPSDGGER